MEARRRYRIGEILDRLRWDILIPRYPKTISQPSKETYTLDLEVNAFINRSSPSKCLVYLLMTLVVSYLISMCFEMMMIVICCRVDYYAVTVAVVQVVILL